MGKPPMPDTPPTPTVIESDRILARKWYRCGCGATYETIMESEPAARQRHHHHVADEVESVASQIAAAREAWGAEHAEALHREYEGFRSESEPAARQRHHHHVADEVESVASQIAAAREAWGAEHAEALHREYEGLLAKAYAASDFRTEAVAALVEAANSYANGRHTASCRDEPGGKIEPWIDCACRIRDLRAALGRVKG